MPHLGGRDPGRDELVEHAAEKLERRGSVPIGRIATGYSKCLGTAKAVSKRRVSWVAKSG